MRPQKMKNCECAVACACREKQPLSFRARRQIAAAVFLAIALGAGLIVMLLGGCSESGSPGTYAARASERPFVGNQGSSWETVFSTPMVAQAALSGDPRAWPEYSRNDIALNNRPNQPLLATNQWPERERPDLSYARRIYIDTRADTLLYFQSSADYSNRPYGSNGYGSGAGRVWYYPTGP